MKNITLAFLLLGSSSLTFGKCILHNSIYSHSPWGHVNSSGVIHDTYYGGYSPWGHIDSSGIIHDTYDGGNSPWGHIDSSGIIHDTYYGGYSPWGHAKGIDCEKFIKG